MDNHSTSAGKTMARILIKMENKMDYKCFEERSRFINKQLTSIINREFKTFSAIRKIEKQLQKENRGTIVLSTPTMMERVRTFRMKEKEVSLHKFEKQNKVDHVRSERVLKLYQSRRRNNFEKVLMNESKMSKVRKNLQKIENENFQKIEKLKESLVKESKERRSYSSKSSSCHLDKVSIVRQMSIRKQNEVVNDYLHKEKKRQEKSLAKQLKFEIKKEKASITSSKNLMTKRNHKEEDLIEKWKSNYENRVKDFETNKEKMLMEKRSTMMERSLQKSFISDEVRQRKAQNEKFHCYRNQCENTKKLSRILSISHEKRQRQSFRNSIVSRKIHRNMKVSENKPNHNEEMKKICQIIRKIKKMGKTDKILPHQVQILLKQMKFDLRNMNNKDPLHNKIMEFVLTSRDKYLEKKERQYEENKGKNKGKTIRIL